MSAYMPVYVTCVCLSICLSVYMSARLCIYSRLVLVHRIIEVPIRGLVQPPQHPRIVPRHGVAVTTYTRLLPLDNGWREDVGRWGYPHVLGLVEEALAPLGALHLCVCVALCPPPPALRLCDYMIICNSRVNMEWSNEWNGERLSWMRMNEIEIVNETCRGRKREI